MKEVKGRATGVNLPKWEWHLDDRVLYSAKGWLDAVKSL